MENGLDNPLVFEHVYGEFRGRVHGYLLGMTKDPVEAEDLTQETFVKIERALPEFRGESSLATWGLPCGHQHLPRSPQEPEGAREHGERLAAPA